MKEAILAKASLRADRGGHPFTLRMGAPLPGALLAYARLVVLQEHEVPLLKAGYIVLCDRYKFTAFARDTVRGCSPEWVRKIYNFAALPDLTFFFRAPLEVSLNRILHGRPQLKYHEAGMDLGLSNDIEESFKLFQGRLLKVYGKMKSEFGLIQINANQPIEEQQQEVRQRLAKSIDLKQYQLDN